MGQGEGRCWAGRGGEPHPDCEAQGGVDRDSLDCGAFLFGFPPKMAAFPICEKVNFPCLKINFRCQKILTGIHWRDGAALNRHLRDSICLRTVVKSSIFDIPDLCQELNHLGVPHLKPRGAAPTHTGVSETPHPLAHLRTLSSICAARGLSLKACAASGLCPAGAFPSTHRNLCLFISAKGQRPGLSPSLMFCLFSRHSALGGHANLF